MYASRTGAFSNITFVAATPTSADGQPLGQRGLRTRQRILEVIGAAIQQHGLRGIRLADIADEVGFQPPAFYQYFNALAQANLALERKRVVQGKRGTVSE